MGKLSGRGFTFPIASLSSPERQGVTIRSIEFVLSKSTRIGMKRKGTKRLAWHDQRRRTIHPSRKEPLEIQVTTHSIIVFSLIGPELVCCMPNACNSSTTRCVHTVNQKKLLIRRLSVVPTPGTKRDTNLYDEMTCKQIERVTKQEQEEDMMKTYFVYLSAMLTTYPCMF